VPPPLAPLSHIVILAQPSEVVILVKPESPYFVLAVACIFPTQQNPQIIAAGTTFGTRYPRVFDEVTVNALACFAQAKHTRNRCMGTVPVETNT